MVKLSARVERFPVAGAFTIARGAKTHVDVVLAEASDGGFVGRGEGTPIYYHGETAEACAAAIEALSGAELTRAGLLQAMPPGAARNALDSALWDLEAQRTGEPVWRRAGLPAPGPLVTAFTISLGDPDAMARAAEAARGHPLLKLKLGGEGDRARVAAVRKAAPEARLIVDANESWAGLDIEAEAAALAALGVELIEQPLPAGQEQALAGVRSPVPLCADESCQSRADLDRCVGAFQAINIKLDKAGGLTEALALAAEAKARGLKRMVGCMLSTSLGIAPAALLASMAEWIDLDGPLLLAEDRPGGFTFANGRLVPPPVPLWGSPRP